jgi:hypothetical protein
MNNSVDELKSVSNCVSNCSDDYPRRKKKSRNPPYSDTQPPPYSSLDSVNRLNCQWTELHESLEELEVQFNSHIEELEAIESNYQEKLKKDDIETAERLELLRNEGFQNYASLIKKLEDRRKEIDILSRKEVKIIFMNSVEADAADEAYRYLCGCTRVQPIRDIADKSKQNFVAYIKAYVKNVDCELRRHFQNCCDVDKEQDANIKIELAAKWFELSSIRRSAELWDLSSARARAEVFIDEVNQKYQSLSNAIEMDHSSGKLGLVNRHVRVAKVLSSLDRFSEIFRSEGFGKIFFLFIVIIY